MPSKKKKYNARFPAVSKSFTVFNSILDYQQFFISKITDFQ